MSTSRHLRFSSDKKDSYSQIHCKILNNIDAFHPNLWKLDQKQECNEFLNKLKTSNSFLKLMFFSNKKLILSKNVDFLNLAMYFSSFTYKLSFYFDNFLGFDLELGSLSHFIADMLIEIKFSNFNFFVNGKLVGSCQDIIDANLTHPRSLFQLNNRYFYSIFTFHSMKFKQPICPLVFHESKLWAIKARGMVVSFFKTSIMTFTNDTFDDLDSDIFTLNLLEAENVALNFKLMNPSVFRNLISIECSGSIQKIDENLFKTFTNIKHITLTTAYLKK